jgi:D-arabinose 5-phosphate isomerase GutQ
MLSKASKPSPARWRSLPAVSETNLRRWSDFILQYSARAVICGMGKSGLVGKKIAATLASAGENDPCRPVDVVEIFGR